MMKKREDLQSRKHAKSALAQRWQKRCYSTTPLFKYKMAALKNLFKLSVGAVSVGSLWMISDEKKNNRMVYALSFGSDVFDGDKRTSWDHNWDKRKPIIKKDSSSESSTERDSNDAKVVKPTAKRYLILIRHGQYVHAEKSEDKVCSNHVWLDTLEIVNLFQ